MSRHTRWGWWLAVGLLFALLRMQPFAVADDPRELKVFAKRASRTAPYEFGPLRLQGRPPLVIRNAEELAAACTEQPSAASGDPVPKAADPKRAEAKLLGVDKIDWKKQMVIAMCTSTSRVEHEVEFIAFRVKDDTLTVRWKDKSFAGYNFSTAKGVALIERFDGKVKFDPDLQRDK